ncbi:SDR family NAD(P)-dependent oxidoreductase [Niabella beijingensis]|uniref:SDR family NAD(P)-dependent oxidoreductase n=1 Tax=Niabella beijingensis TaxID=2872700 RepID=UPI001CC15FBF|nr:SDR family oxidoreductase [Niabella beijingensis]MBZ4191972.1 SDR family oxidoreductase [Niabella beijingensis]
MEPKRKIAIVTGGGSGLGNAIARKFLQNDIETIIVGRNAGKLQEAGEHLDRLCHAKVLDITDFGAIPAFVDTVAEEFGRIDILVNNAGINMKKDFETVTDEEFQKIMNTNVNAVFALSREVTKYMLQAGSGCIINISSMAALYGLPKVIAYSASKSAVDGMTRAMAVELAPGGIRVNSIAPGFIYSDMTDKALNSDPDRKARVFARTPMGKMGQPEDIARAALYLASDAAEYVTGITLPVDGGNSIGF